ncbi:MAG: hypothetical protein HY072_10665 [Deltaproteobacteria bacterium]|nr:hypothetical protein [Deltaproteobacteria bacterium]
MKAIKNETIEGKKLAIGHQPLVHLSPQDEELFRSFQSNLLSLISHELRTPLMGVLNALTLLEEQSDEHSEITSKELLNVARKNAIKLQHNLSSVLDLAAIESKNFHIRLREMNLSRLMEAKLKNFQPLFLEQEIKCELEKKFQADYVIKDETAEEITALADPQRLGRVLDLCFHVILSKIKQKSLLKITFTQTWIEMGFQLKEDCLTIWDEEWSKSLVAFQSGVSSPNSAFSGTIQSEQAFLTRSSEGLGAELWLIHEVLKLHSGSFLAERKNQFVKLTLLLPELNSLEGLRAALSSRLSQISPEQGGISSVVLVFVRPPKKWSMIELGMSIKKGLFRSSDSIYILNQENLIALILDDCKPEDVPKLLSRIQSQIGSDFSYSLSSCPRDGFDIEDLIAHARN